MVRFKKEWEEGFDLMQQEMDRLLGHLSSLKPPSVRFSPRAWAPSTDICETEDSILVLVELAGMREDEIRIETEQDVLVVSGERKDPRQGIKRSFFQMEIIWGPFETRIPLPQGADVERATATYHVGFLEITIPKASSRTSRQVIINPSLK